MILVDTSCWIDFFRNVGGMSSIVSRLIEENIVTTCGPIFTEIIRGTSSEKTRNKLILLFNELNFLEQPENLWEEAGLLGAYSAKRGHTIKSFDLLIAAYAIFYDIPLLTKDRDFHILKRIGTGLRLV